jgi:hypothetical protein
VGYPIAEIEADGSAVITKPEESGGQVTSGTIAEQLVYEIDDPTRYRTPDVDVDFTTVNLREVGPARVRVHGARGVAPSSQLKASCIYRDGWTASGLLAVVGPDAAAKARFCGQLILGRVKSSGFVLEDSLIECFGAGDIVPGVLSPRSAPWEVVLRVTARDPRRNAVDRFCREFAPLVTSGPPGIAGYASGRPEVRPAFGYFPTLVPRNLLEPQVEILPAREWSDSKDAKSPEPHSA